MAKTDLEIAQECVMEPIEKVAAKIGIPADSLEHYGKYKAKLSFDFLKSIENICFLFFIQEAQKSVSRRFFLE